MSNFCIALGSPRYLIIFIVITPVTGNVVDVLFKYILQSFPFCLVLSDISEPLLQKCAMIFEITFTEITACLLTARWDSLFCRCFGQVVRVLRLGLGIKLRPNLTETPAKRESRDVGRLVYKACSLADSYLARGLQEVCESSVLSNRC